MKALIPAAGKGKRLRPLTNHKPKALVEINGRPLIQWLIEELQGLGIQEIFVIKGYLGEKLKEGLKDWEVRFLEQEEQLGTAHAIGRSDFDEPFLVVSGDHFVHPKNLEKIRREFNRGGRKAVIGSKRVENPKGFGVLETENGRIKGIVEKPENPPSNLINTGVYIFTPDIYDYIQRTHLSERGEYEITDSIQLMLEDGCLVTHTLFENYWIDIGRWEDLERARSLDV